MPIQIVKIISGSDSWKVDRPWKLGNILCKLSCFLPDVSLVVSIESLLLIAMDRFVATIFPHTKLEVIESALNQHSVYVDRSSCSPCTLFLHFKTENAPIRHVPIRPDHVETNNRFVTATFITFILAPICDFAIVYDTIAWVLKRKNTQTKRQLLFIDNAIENNN